MLKPLGKNILVEETLTKRNKGIHLLNDDVKDKEIYTRKLKVIGVGPDYEGPIEIDSEPVIAEWAAASVSINISGKVGEDVIVQHSVFNPDHIVAIAEGE